jgi:hypothetical protein
MRRLALAMVLSALLVQGAAAQTGDRWLIVPVATSADSWVEPTVRDLYDELAARGIAVWSPDDAARRFEAVESAPGPVLTDDEKAAWAEQSNAVLESLVRGDPEGALRLLRDANLLALSKIVALNRVPDQAQRVLDTCLLGVRALLETEAVEEAESMARECRKLVMTGTPTPNMHPPPVLDQLAAADDYRSKQTTVLHVGSAPPGCPVRVNGLLLAETPLEEPGLLPGRYAVQVECDPEWRSRVHYTEVAFGFTEVEVDARFDAAVVTRPTLGLRYSDSSEAEEHSHRDATAIAEAVSVTGLVLISAPDTATLELELVRGPALERAGFARIKGSPSGPTRGDTALATRTLIDGKCMDLTKLPPAALPCGDETAAAAMALEHPARMPQGKFISGMTLFAAGGASLLTGYVLLGPRARTSEDWVRALDAARSSAALQQKWFNMGVGQVLTASVGGAALVTAMPLALPKRDKPPWWAWLSGGIGLGAAAYSIAYGVTAKSEPGTSCSNLITDGNDARSCVERSERINVAVLVGATAAPLLTIPLVYVFRPTKSKLSPKVEVSRAGGSFVVHGEF